MTFLQLVQKLRRKCRVSGSGPVTLVGQVEEYQRLIDWVNEAWVDIQTTREDWLWMRSSFSFQTVTGQASYTPAQIGLTDLGFYAQQTFRNYQTAVGLTSEAPMSPVEGGFDAWRDQYYMGALRLTQSRPNVFSIAPDFSVCLGPVPAAGYTVTGDYYKVATELVLDGDTPGIQPMYHMMIVYRAMMYYGASEAAPEIYQEGEVEWRKMMARLAVAQLSDISAPDSLA